jgi:hypothetical protein
MMVVVLSYSVPPPTTLCWRVETTPTPEITQMPSKRGIKIRRKYHLKAYEEQLLLMFPRTHPPRKAAVVDGWPHLAHGDEKSYDFSR